MKKHFHHDNGLVRELVIGASRPSPPLVPNLDRAVFLVLDDFGPLGHVWRKTTERNTDLEAMLSNFLRKHYRDPVKVVGFNTNEGWSMDVSVGVAQAIRRMCDERRKKVPEFLQNFIHRHDPEPEGSTAIRNRSVRPAHRR